MLIKSRIQEFAEKIEEIKNKETDIDIELGSVLSTAERELDSKSFKKLLKDPKVGYKTTQAKKYIKFHEGIHGQTPDLIRKVGVEKYYIISNVKDEETRNDLLSFVNDYDVSCRILNKMTKIIAANTAIEFTEAYEQAKTPTKKEKKKDNSPDYVPKAEYDELNKKYYNALNEIKILKESIENERNTAIFKNAISSIPKTNLKPIARKYIPEPLSTPKEDIA